MCRIGSVDGERKRSPSSAGRAGMERAVSLMATILSEVQRSSFTRSNGFSRLFSEISLLLKYTASVLTTRSSEKSPTAV